MSDAIKLPRIKGKDGNPGWMPLDDEARRQLAAGERPWEAVEVKPRSKP